MSEKASNILTEFKDGLQERLSSPIIGTYIISYLITNWRVPVGLFLPIEQIKDAKYDSYFDLIAKNSNWWLPLIIVLIYIFGYPYVVEWVKWFKKNATNWVQDNSIKRNFFFYEKKYFHISEKKRYLEEIKTLSEKLNGKNSEFNFLSADFSNLNSEFSKMKFMASSQSLKGVWESDTPFLNEGRYKFNNAYRYSISGNIISIVSNDNSQNDVPFAKIQLFAKTENTNESMTLISLDSDNNNLIHLRLIFSDNLDNTIELTKYEFRQGDFFPKRLSNLKRIS